MNGGGANVNWDKIFISSVGVRHWFGQYDHETHQAIRIPGTRPYVAPEVLQKGNDALSNASDIWALGCIGAELVTNRRLFETPAALDAFVERHEVDPALNALLQKEEDVTHILGGCMKVDPDERPSIFMLRAELEQLRENYPM
jgi:serine/threonine protein kinase